MKIAIGNDHAGVEVKKNIEKLLSEKGYTVINKGYDGRESVDYPELYTPRIDRSKRKESTNRNNNLWKWQWGSNDS